MADSGMFILGDTLGVAGGGSGATGRGKGRGGAAGSGAATPDRDETGGDASGDCKAAGWAAGGAGTGIGGATGRGSGSGGAAALGADTPGCGPGTGGVAATGGGAAGRGVPQYPQNLLPAGNDLWHFGHKTWGTAVGTGARTGGAGASGRTGDDPRFWGFPQRTQAGADAGFIAPQEAQRMYRTVPCSFPSGVIFYAHLDFSRHHSPVALIQMGLV